eukprot:484846-Prorocentrum_minimum.AAC.2
MDASVKASSGGFSAAREPQPSGARSAAARSAMCVRSPSAERERAYGSVATLRSTCVYHRLRVSFGAPHWRRGSARTGPSPRCAPPDWLQGITRSPRSRSFGVLEL